MFRVPFGAEEFFAVFASYNRAVWPLQIVWTAGACGAAWVALRRGGGGTRWVWGFLAALWAWTGGAYHLLHFTAVNPAAWAFGVLFLVQAALFLWKGVLRGPLPFDARRGVEAWVGGSLLAYALVVYPLLGLASGHGYLEGPTFGAPCPVVIYTFGLLVLAPAAPVGLLVVPTAWAVIGSSAVLAFGVLQDVGLPVAAFLAVAVRVVGPGHRLTPPRPGTRPGSVRRRP